METQLDLSPLKHLAPNITLFELEFRAHSAHILVFSQICQLWPQLEVVKIKGSGCFPERNYDADFCGIYEEEASYLREQGEQFLDVVHIVPIKPSLMTMPSE